MSPKAKHFLNLETKLTLIKVKPKLNLGQTNHGLINDILK